MLKQKLLNQELNKVFIGIGSNFGDKINNIYKVYYSFIKDSNFSNIKKSSLYETKPYGKIDQDNFINAVFYFETPFSLQQLFNYTKDLEKKIGRIKRERWGPREIDIDILLFNNLVFEDEKITIPHKDLLKRDFVLIPLIEIDDKVVHPKEKKELKKFLINLNDRYIINKISSDFLVEKTDN